LYFSEYEKCKNDCYRILEKPASGPGILTGFAQAWSLTKGLSAIIKIQNCWQEINAIIDEKYTAIFILGGKDESKQNEKHCSFRSPRQAFHWRPADATGKDQSDHCTVDRR
jgi:hypothetical protein